MMMIVIIIMVFHLATECVNEYGLAKDRSINHDGDCEHVGYDEHDDVLDDDIDHHKC